MVNAYMDLRCWILDIAVVDDEKAIREHICVLIEEQKPGSSIEAYATGEESA